jgi:hypothetical protein
MKVGLDLIKFLRGSPTMKAWETNKSPKAVASICCPHEILQQEIKQGVELRKCTTMIDTHPAAAQCQEKAPDNGAMLRKSAGRRCDA